MTELNKNNIPYSPSDIEKYRKGELSARQMHDLEQAALDDPFLADAMEGLMQNPPPSQDFEELHKRLNTKVAEEKRRAAVILIRRRIAVAAAIILVLGLGYTFFHLETTSFSKPKQPAPAAVARNTAPATVTAPAPVTEPAPVIEPAPVTTPPATASTKSSVKHHARAATATTAPASSWGYADSEVIADTTYADLYKNSNLALKKTEVEKKKYYQDSVSYFSAEKNPGLTLNNDLKLKSIALPSAGRDDTEKYAASFNAFRGSPVVINGKVLDLQNRPVAGAFLALNSNTGIGTTTDERGQFTLTLRQPDTTRQLTVSMIGFDRASFNLDELGAADKKSNVIYLKPSTTNLDEVVVVGYGAHRKATEVAPPSDSNEKLDTLWKNAAPVVGSQAYLQYIDAAKKKLGLDSTIRGKETISFLVSRDGSLTGFKIEQSISPAHDAGIIRLVTDGPAWRIRRGRTVRAAVTVNF